MARRTACLINQGFQVTGIDASKNLLRIARQNCPNLKCVYGDIRTVELKRKYDAVLEWWCLFHLPKSDHAKMISRFASWLKPGGLLEFTTSDLEYEGSSSEMLGQELCFYSLAPNVYEKELRQNGFKLLLRDNDQEQHMVWIAKLIG